VLRRNDDLGDLLDQIGRRRIGLTIDDVGEVLGAALKDQRRAILAHVDRKFQLQEVNANSARSEERFKNLHRRLIEVEAEIRALKRGDSR
jgi:hypothetical protein